LFIANDTISGLIKNKGESKIKNQIEFKYSMDEKTIKYSAKDIFGFEIANRKYISREIILNNKKAHVFLEYLVDGIKDLYFLRDKNEYHFYISFESDSLIELKNTESIIVINGQSYSKPNFEFKKMLSFAFIDAPELTESINNLSYSYNDLIEITKKYHDITCPNGVCTIYSKANESKSTFGISIGTRFSDSNFSFNTAENPTFLNKSPKLELSYSISNLAGFSNLEQVIGIGYFHNRIKNKRRELIFNNISIPVYLKYHKRIKNIDPFFKIGFENTFHFGKNIKNAQPIVDIIEEVVTYQFWGILGIGTDLNILNQTFIIESNIILGKGFNRTIYSYRPTLHFDRINLEFMLGYKF
nr:hypothetical protein [Prolixibacteraceae bacterium]